MKISKLFLLAICLSMSSCCCNDKTGVPIHLNPIVKNSLPYKDGQQLTFIDSATNQKVIVNCTTKSKFETWKCYLYQESPGCPCREDEFEYYSIQLRSSDSTLKVNIDMDSQQKDTTFWINIHALDSFPREGFSIRTNDLGVLRCLDSTDSTYCANNKQLINLPFKNLFELSFDGFPKGSKADSLNLNFIQKVWLNKADGIVKLRYKNGKSYFLQP
jgi:hypothetical protein